MNFSIIPHTLYLYIGVFLWLLSALTTQAQNRPDIHFDFDQNVISDDYHLEGSEYSYADGVLGHALNFVPKEGYSHLHFNDALLGGSRDFSIQFWFRTTTNLPMAILAQKEFDNKGIPAQLNPGWAIYLSGGNLGWCIGSGDRRINYERDNGDKAPLNDDQWHQLTMTFDQDQSEIRLYRDGHNIAIYKVNFEFANELPLVLGSVDPSFDHDSSFSPEIVAGKERLQAFVDAFNELGLESLRDEEFIDLIVDPKEVLDKRGWKEADLSESNRAIFNNALEIRSALRSNPYTVYQNRGLTMLKPVSRLYVLRDGKVAIDKEGGKQFTMSEQLYPADYFIDELSIWYRALDEKEVQESFNRYHSRSSGDGINDHHISELNVGVWNIWHGGIHWNKEQDGWDSRQRIAEMIREKNLDVVLMQETYSSGDYIAAELGYYFATTSDWDYCFQGANISVLSRYPIEEVQVSEETEFNNVAVKLAISNTQSIWAISNWYGMAQFPTVFDFHKYRFDMADDIPVLFGGDFNAVPHTDGGKSPASVALLNEGFTDAFRSSYPNVETEPGHTHRSGSRIDQLYYKGKSLDHQFTEVISSWPSGFPSDHYLIVSRFELKTTSE